MKTISEFEKQIRNFNDFYTARLTLGFRDPNFVVMCISGKQLLSTPNFEEALLVFLRYDGEFVYKIREEQ